MDSIYIDISDLNEWVAKHFNKDLISIKDLIGCIEDLDADVERLQEELADVIEDRDTNYRRIPVSEQVRDSE